MEYDNVRLLHSRRRRRKSPTETPRLCKYTLESSWVCYTTLTRHSLRESAPSNNCICSNQLSMQTVLLSSTSCISMIASSRWLVIISDASNLLSILALPMTIGHHIYITNSSLDVLHESYCYDSRRCHRTGKVKHGIIDQITTKLATPWPPLWEQLSIEKSRTLLECTQYLDFVLPIVMKSVFRVLQSCTWCSFWSMLDQCKGE